MYSLIVSHYISHQWIETHFSLSVSIHVSPATVVLIRVTVHCFKSLLLQRVGLHAVFWGVGYKNVVRRLHRCYNIIQTVDVPN